MSRSWKELWHNQGIYGVYAISLLAPGCELPVLRADQTTPSELKGWSTAELALLIDEGRRQCDRQERDLSDIRGRSQWLFTVAVAALGALATGLVTRHPGTADTVLWVAGLILLTYGVAGAASVMVSRADFKTIHAAVLSGVEQPIEMSLAKAYARMMATGENTVATRLTVFRQGVLFCLVGGYVALVAALVSG